MADCRDRKVMRSEGSRGNIRNQKSPGLWEETKANEECVQEAEGIVVCLLWSCSSLSTSLRGDSHGGTGTGHHRRRSYVSVEPLCGFSKDAAPGRVGGVRGSPGAPGVGRGCRDGEEMGSGGQERDTEGKVRGWRREKPHALPPPQLHFRESSAGPFIIIINIIIIPFGDKGTETVRHSVICPNSHNY